MGKLLMKIGKLNRAPGGARSVPRLCSWGAGPSSPGELRYYARTLRPNEIIQVVLGKYPIKIGKLGGSREAPARCHAGARGALAQVLPANFGIMRKLSARMKSFKYWWGNCQSKSENSTGHREAPARCHAGAPRALAQLPPATSTIIQKLS